MNSIQCKNCRRTIPFNVEMGKQVNFVRCTGCQTRNWVKLFWKIDRIMITRTSK